MPRPISRRFHGSDRRAKHRLDVRARAGAAGEDDPPDLHAPGTRAITADGVATLERLTIASP